MAKIVNPQLVISSAKRCNEFDCRKDSGTITKFLFLFNYMKKRNQNVYFVLGNDIFYTLLDDFNSICKDLSGESYSQDLVAFLDDKWDEVKKNNKKLAMKEYKKISKEGLDYIYPQRKKEWLQFTRGFAEDFYLWSLSDSLEVLAQLDRGEDFELVFDFIIWLCDGRTFMDYPAGYYEQPMNIIFTVVKQFSKRGPEFCRYLFERLGITPPEGELTEIEEENKKFKAEFTKSI